MIGPVTTTFALAAALTFAAAPAPAAEIKLIASNAVKEAYTELVPEFEKATGHRVAISWTGTVNILERIRSREAADLIVSTAASVDDLTREGLLVSGSRVDAVRSIIGVAVRPGVARPDISSGEALKRALLEAKSVVLSGGPSSFYLLELFERMGIAEAIKAKLTRLPPGSSAGEALARGEGDLGFTQVSELLAVHGIDYIGPLSADVQQVTIFSLALPKNAREAEAAQSLIRFLTASEAAPVLKKAGLSPG